MRSILLLALILLIQLAIGSAQASGEKTHRKENASLGTSFRFSPNALNGRYQNPQSSSVVVEGDKYLDDLLAPRKNFMDRNKQDLERN